MHPVLLDRASNVPQQNVKSHENHLEPKLKIAQIQNVNINVKKDIKKLTEKKCSNVIGEENGQWIRLFNARVSYESYL